MVFSSIPAYLDPANWQQYPNHQIGATSSATIQLPVPAPPPPPPPPPPLQQPHGGSTGSIRPGSMADRARLANMPMPEAALKCPRCESTNTKFCYFNNYSLTQPRHFCKTCRRYWTRGGALRNVPVGGGCRRNKRSKSGSSSKSPVSSADRQTGGSCNSSSTVSSNSGAGHDMLGLLGGPQVPPPLRFMAPLHHLTSEFTSGDIGLNYGTGLSSTPTGAVSDMSFQIGTALASVDLGSSLLPVGGLDQYRLQQAQQFSCFGGLDSASSSYPFDQGGAEPSGYGGGGGGGQIRSPKISISGAATQLASVKMEERNQGLNLSRQFLGIPAGNDQYWNGTPWTDLSSTFSSSSTSNPL